MTQELSRFLVLADALDNLAAKNAEIDGYFCFGKSLAYSVAAKLVRKEVESIEKDSR